MSGQFSVYARDVNAYHIEGLGTTIAAVSALQYGVAGNAGLAGTMNDAEDAPLNRR